MNELGISKLSLHVDGSPSSVELWTPPQAPPDVDEGESDTPLEGRCVYPGCAQKSGWRYAPEYCRAHGMAAMGVK